MKTKDVYELTPVQLIDRLRELGVKVTDQQSYHLRYCCYRTCLYETKKPLYNKTKFVFRLTFPLFLIWSVVFLRLIQLVKWLFTGNLYFSTNGLIYKFTVSWENKIGL